MRLLKEQANNEQTFNHNQGRANRIKIAKIAGLPVDAIFMINGIDRFEIMNLSENEYHLVYNKLRVDKSISQLSSSHRPDFKHMNFMTNLPKEKYTIYGIIG